MPYTHYLTVQASKQGLIGAEKKEAKGLPILGYSLGVKSPRDVASGQATGKRVHEPLQVFRHIDAATPKLFQATVTGEVLSEVVIAVYRIGANGKEMPFLTVRLKKALLSAFEHEPDEVEGETEIETIALGYETIEITHHPTNVTAVDSLARV
jgi:type VI secretion system secreted protein Hcp